MKIFLSWSGQRSNRVARILGDWICQVIQAVEPWFSSDIEKGARWNEEISAQLDSTEFGIICLTKDNLQSTWLHFEAGALAKRQDGRVCTFLLDIQPPAVKPPLSDFQATVFDRDEIFKLLLTINSRLTAGGERPLAEERLNRLFERFWPDLERDLQQVVQDKKGARSSPERSVEDRLDEILLTVRHISSALGANAAPTRSSPMLLEALRGWASHSSLGTGNGQAEESDSQADRDSIEPQAIKKSLSPDNHGSTAAQRVAETLVNQKKHAGWSEEMLVDLLADKLGVSRATARSVIRRVYERRDSNRVPESGRD